MKSKKTIYVKIATVAALLGFLSGLYAVFINLNNGIIIAFICWMVGIGSFIFMYIDTNDIQENKKE